MEVHTFSKANKRGPKKDGSQKPNKNKRKGGKIYYNLTDWPEEAMAITKPNNMRPRKANSTFPVVNNYGAIMNKSVTL